MLWLLVTLLLETAQAAPPPDSLALASLPTPAFIEPAPPPPAIQDFYRYRVVYRWHGMRCVRWRTDYIMSSVITAAGDTLGFNLTNSQLAELVARTNLPDTAQVNMAQWIARYEQRQNGQITRLYYVNDFDQDRLRELDDYWQRRTAPSHLPVTPSRK